MMFLVFSCPEGAYLWRAFLVRSWEYIRGCNLHNCIFKRSPLLDVIVSFEPDRGENGLTTHIPPTLTETFIALYVNKGFQYTVGQRLKSTMGAPLLNSHSRASRVQRTYWKECTQYWFKHGSVSTLILEPKQKSIFPLRRCLHFGLRRCSESICWLKDSCSTVVAQFTYNRRQCGDHFD